MSKIVEIRQDQSQEIYLCQPLTSLLDILLNVRYDGETEFTTIKFLELLETCKSQISGATNFATMVCNKQTYQRGHNVSANTQFNYTDLDAEYMYLCDFATQEVNGEAVFSISVYTNYGSDSYYTLTFDLPISANGYYEFSVSPIVENVNIDTRPILTLDMFNIRCYDAHGQAVAFDVSQEGKMFYSKNLTANRPSTSGSDIFENDEFEVGRYYVSLVISKHFIMSTDIYNTYVNCYDNEPVDIIVEPLKTIYRQYELFDRNNDIQVYKKFQIEEDYFYEEMAYDFSNSPSTFDTVTQTQQVTIYLNEFSKTYNVSVFGLQSDNVYYYDKSSPFAKHLLGELQSNYNMSITMDESKDSCKIVVLSFVKKELEPNTVVYLESTNTWWCVDRDKVNRHQNENQAIYEHSITLVGLIELLGSRDLTNCGFNSERYKVSRLVNRLIDLSDLELRVTVIYGNFIKSDEYVNYLKTFENYTLLSALKEIFNGFNCVPKMVATESSNKLYRFIIKAYPKSGTSEEPINESVFDDTTEQTTISKENFGTRVVSNIQNCVAKSSVRYPLIGATQLNGKDGEITYENATNARLLLPTKAYYVDSITFYNAFKIEFGYGNRTAGYYISPEDLSRRGEIAKQYFVYYLTERGASISVINEFKNNWVNIFNEIKEYGIFELKNGGYYDAIANIAYEPNLQSHNAGYAREARIYLNNEIYSYNTDGKFNFNLKWKQGSNEITGFEFLPEFQRVLAGYPNTYFIKGHFNKDYGSYSIHIDENSNLLRLLVDTTQTHNARSKTLYSVKYIPMTDLKLKTENDRFHNDTKLYNQNGKLIDSYAVSKLVNGYAQSISSNEIIKNKTYYNFFKIPQVGQRVKVGSDIYVINNISYDFSLNENLHYCIPCQFTMTKQSACKSIMISANSKIRDYDCPQQNNIKRVQCYRDYVELDYELNSNEQTYLAFNKLFNLYDLNSIGIVDELMAFAKCSDSSFLNPADYNSESFYYRVNSICFDLNKHKMYVIDFNDNNIIGYSAQNIKKPWEIGSIFDLEKSINVPISYVDSYGELDKVEVLLTTKEDAETAFGDVPIDFTCVITPSVYNTAKTNALITITENDYYKDGLEVPVFEYCAECGDTNGIIMADNFFEYGENYDGIYLVDCPYLITNENQANVVKGTKRQGHITISGREIDINFNTDIGNLYGKNIGVYAKKGNEYRFLFGINEYKKSLSFIRLYINTYKLK